MNDKVPNDEKSRTTKSQTTKSRTTKNLERQNLERQSPNQRRKISNDKISNDKVQNDNNNQKKNSNDKIPNHRIPDARISKEKTSNRLSLKAAAAPDVMRCPGSRQKVNRHQTGSCGKCAQSLMHFIVHRALPRGSLVQSDAAPTEASVKAACMVMMLSKAATDTNESDALLQASGCWLMRLTD